MSSNPVARGMLAVSTLGQSELVMMAANGVKKSLTPSIPNVPGPSDPAPTQDSKAVQASADASMDANRARNGRRSTIATSPQGVLSTAPIAKASLTGKSLLGG